MKRLLIIEPNWLGDVLFTTPAIRAIKNKHKEAYITILTHKRCVSILENNPNINEIFALEGKRGFFGFIENLKIIPWLKNRRFDIVFFFSRSATLAFACALAGISERIGYYTRRRSFWLTQKLIAPAQEPHRVEYFLNIIRSIGIDTDNKDYEFFLKDEERAKALSILRNNGISENQPYFVINPCGNWLPKRWPKEDFAKLANELFNKYNIKVVITGSEKDIPLGDSIRKLCALKPTNASTTLSINHEQNRVINLCGKTTLPQLAAVLKHARVVIANDTGSMHIAVSQKTPTVALFGPTDPDITGPYGNSRYIVVKKEIDCPVPCYSKNCRKNRCMEGITVADVMEAVEKLL